MGLGFERPSDMSSSGRVAFRRDWLQSGAVTRLLERLNDGTQPSEGGGISFTATDHDDLFFLLADCIVAPSELTRNDVSSASYRAFLDLRKHGPVDAKHLLSAISERVSRLIATELKTFTMWTVFRIRETPGLPGNRFQIDDVSINIYSALPSWLRLQEHFISGIGNINPNTLSFFRYIVFRTPARNENHASEKMFRALDTFYAVVNTAWRSTEFFTQRHSTAKIWPGPYQFLFEERQFVGNDKVWYNPNFDEKEWHRFPKSASDFAKRTKIIKRVLSRLQQHPLRAQLERAMVFASEGMISQDLSFRLMRFWSAAEALYTSESERANFKKLIDRMIFAASENKEIERMKLERAYIIRNSYVHHGSTENDDNSLTENLRESVLIFAFYILFNGDDIQNHTDLLMMLDLPADESALATRRQAIERRLRLIQTGRHRADVLAG